MAAELRFDEAAHILLFRTIDDIEQRRPHALRPALTSRDIARLEEIPPPARTAFARLAEVVERSFFGGRALGQADFDALPRRLCDLRQSGKLDGRSVRVSAVQTPVPSRPFSGVAVLWMLVAGVVSALLFLVLTAYAPDLRQSSDGESHALSKSAVGFAGLTQLLKDEGAPVLFSRSLHPDLDGAPNLLVVTPALGSNPRAMSAPGIAPALNLWFCPSGRRFPTSAIPAG